MLKSFRAQRDELEKEGVYIGGWSFKNVLTPKKLDGKHGKQVPTLPSTYSHHHR